MRYQGYGSTERYFEQDTVETHSGEKIPLPKIDTDSAKNLKVIKTKKNPKVDLNRNSGLYFVIGLTFVLFLRWRAKEFKSYDTPIKEIIMAQMSEPGSEEELR